MQSDYVELIIVLCKEAGKIIRTDFSSDMKKRWKEGVIPVTQTDLKIDALAASYIREHFPTHALLGKSPTDSPYVWQWDPIDGTVAFTHGIPTCVFSLALSYEDKVILGAVYDPFMDRFYYAEKGKGAYLNNIPIQVTPSYSLQSKVVGVGAGHLQNLNLGLLHNALREEGVKVINIYSIIYMAALVASGELTATIFGGENCIDGSSCKILVEEAGGKMTDLTGNEQSYTKNIKGFIASNGLVHDQLVKLVRDKALLS